MRSTLLQLGRRHADATTTNPNTATNTAMNVHLHACQVLVTAEPFPGTEIQRVADCVGDELEERMATELATHVDQWSLSTLRYSSADSENSSSPHGLPYFGGVVDRLLHAHSHHGDVHKMVPCQGVQTTLYYSLYSPKTDLMTDIESRFIGPFHLASSRNSSMGRFKAVGRWPGEFRMDTDPAANAQHRENHWMNKVLATSSLGPQHAPQSSAESQQQQQQQQQDAQPTMFQQASHDHLARSFFLLSDNEPFAALRQLDRVFARDFKHGVVGSWTPFITGHPFTLFVNGKTYSSGTIGVGYTISGSNKDNVRFQHLGLETLGDPLEIKRYVSGLLMSDTGMTW